MNKSMSKIALALAGGLMWAGTAMSANEMRFSDIEARLTAVEQRTSSIPGLKAAAFLSDSEAIDAIAPNDGSNHQTEEVPLPPGGVYQRNRTYVRSKSYGTECGQACGCGDGCECGSACGSACECATTCECEGDCECKTCCASGYGVPAQGSYYADVEIMFLRAHLMESSVGKLSEKYELSPRFVLGYETAKGVGGRIRYWSYGRTATVLNETDDVRFELGVLDFEATSRFRTSRSELVVGGGFRFAKFDVNWADEPVSANLPGVTVAADLRTVLCTNCNQEWATVCGARWSILGGDWEGSDFGLVTPIRDDNVVVQELYGGVEYSQHYRDYVFFTRLVFEIQNWHSDAMSQSAAADSLGFVGPGLHIGAAF